MYLCQIFTDFNFFSTLRLSNKRFLIWLLTTPLHLKYAATLVICRSWLVLLTLMFHRVVWQHMLGAVGFLICIKLQIYEAIFIEKIVNRFRFDRIMVMSLWSRFFGPSYECRLDDYRITLACL